MVQLELNLPDIKAAKSTALQLCWIPSPEVLSSRFQIISHRGHLFSEQLFFRTLTRNSAGKKIKALN